MWSPYVILVGLEIIIYIGSSWVSQLSVTITKPQENQLLLSETVYFGSQFEGARFIISWPCENITWWEWGAKRNCSLLLTGRKQKKKKKMRKGLGSFYFLQGHISNELKASQSLILPKGFIVTWVFGGLEDANYSSS